MSAKNTGLNIEVKIDPKVPENEIWFCIGPKRVGKIVNVLPPVIGPQLTTVDIHELAHDLAAKDLILNTDHVPVEEAVIAWLIGKGFQVQR